MILEEKDLLLKDLCAKLPYGVRISKTVDDFVSEPKLIKSLYPDGEILVEDEFPDVYAWDICEIKPYLRPMSSMTDEELKEFTSIHENVLVAGKNIYTALLGIDSINWLLEHHFDFLGLIPKGLAIEVTEDNNPYKK